MDAGRLFSAASVAFNIAYAPDRPVAQLVFAMAPVALVLTTHLLMQQVSWRRTTPGPTAPGPEQRPVPKPHTRTGRATIPHPSRTGRIEKRSRRSFSSPGGLPSPAGSRAADPDRGRPGQGGRRERYGQRLLAEFTTEPGRPGHRNGASLSASGEAASW